jgi:hypothetical protein
MRASPLSRNPCSFSTATTSSPAIAQICAIPDPISPNPTTPTLRISVPKEPRPPIEERSARFQREPAGAQLREGERVVAGNGIERE